MGPGSGPNARRPAPRVYASFGLEVKTQPTPIRVRRKGDPIDPAQDTLRTFTDRMAVPFPGPKVLAVHVYHHLCLRYRSNATDQVDGTPLTAQDRRARLRQPLGTSP